MKKFKNIIFLYITAILPALCTAGIEDNPTPPLNVIIIMVDDVGTGWIPPYAERLDEEDIEYEIVERYRERRGGGSLDLQAHLEAARNSMPTLNRLAKEGLVFDRVFATSPLCAPSRAGFLTGTLQQRWGAYRNVDLDEKGIPKDQVVLAEPFQAAGYRTAIIGKWHVAPKDPALRVTGPDRDPQSDAVAAFRTSSKPGHHPLDRGFDYYLGFNSPQSNYYGANDLWENHQKLPARPGDEFQTEFFNQKALDFILESVEAEKPFLLYYSPMTLHGRIDPPPVQYSQKFNTGIPFTDQYAGHLLALDDGIENIFNLLGEHNLMDNTLFIFTSDNGCTHYGVPPYNAPNRGGKGSAWMGGSSVPLIIWQKNMAKCGYSDILVSLADLMPTILEAAGMNIPENIDGISLLPYISGDSDIPPRGKLFSSSVHSSRWSYSYEANGERNRLDSNYCPLYAWVIEEDQILLRITAIKPDLYENIPEGYPAQVRLHNLQSDRQQRINQANNSIEKVQQLDEALRQWLRMQKAPISSQQEDYKKLIETPAKPDQSEGNNLQNEAESDKPSTTKKPSPSVL